MSLTEEAWEPANDVFERWAESFPLWALFSAAPASPQAKTRTTSTEAESARARTPREWGTGSLGEGVFARERNSRLSCLRLCTSEPCGPAEAGFVRLYR